MDDARKHLLCFSLSLVGQTVSMKEVLVKPLNIFFSDCHRSQKPDILNSM